MFSCSLSSLRNHSGSVGGATGWSLQSNQKPIPGHVTSKRWPAIRSGDSSQRITWMSNDEDVRCEPRLHASVYVLAIAGDESRVSCRRQSSSVVFVFGPLELRYK